MTPGAPSPSTNILLEIKNDNGIENNRLKAKYTYIIDKLFLAAGSLKPGVWETGFDFFVYVLNNTLNLLNLTHVYQHFMEIRYFWGKENSRM